MNANLRSINAAVYRDFWHGHDINRTLYSQHIPDTQLERFVSVYRQAFWDAMHESIGDDFDDE